MGVRKNAGLLTAAEASTLRQAFGHVLALNDERGYQYQAGIHGLPLPTSCQHHHPLFLPWHRAYVYLFERALQDQVASVALPWWDWTSAAAHREGMPVPYTVRTADGAPNPLLDAPITTLTAAQRRQLAANGLITSGTRPRTFRDPEVPDELPRAATINSILQAPTFDDFTTRLENVHDAVHVWVGGSMSAVPVAAYDPVFWAHHCMIDRLWYLWQLRHPGAGPPAALLRQALAPFPMTVADTLDIGRLGYSYAVQVVS